MKTITYKCDRCGRENTVDSRTTERELNLETIRVGTGQYGYDNAHRGGKEWCWKCRIEVGIDEPTKRMPEAVPLDPLPTLEDMIRELVREEIQNQ